MTGQITSQLRSELFSPVVGRTVNVILNRWHKLVVTIIVTRHDNEEMTKVDGFQEPGSFRQVIVIVNPFLFL